RVWCACGPLLECGLVALRCVAAGPRFVGFVWGCARDQSAAHVRTKPVRGLLLRVRDAGEQIRDERKQEDERTQAQAETDEKHRGVTFPGSDNGNDECRMQNDER